MGLVLAFFVGLFAPQSLWPALLVNQSAALLVLVAGLQSAWWVTQWRAQAMNPWHRWSPLMNLKNRWVGTNGCWSESVSAG